MANLRGMASPDKNFPGGSDGFNEREFAGGFDSDYNPVNLQNPVVETGSKPSGTPHGPGSFGGLDLDALIQALSGGGQQEMF